jgi:hypothetical protein
MMLDQVTAATFSQHLHSLFRLEMGDGQTIQLELVEVESLGHSFSPPSFVRPQPTRPAREAFSIVFRGPLAPELVQNMYTLDHETIGSLAGLFLVPVYRDAEAMYYQAVFN